MSKTKSQQNSGTKSGAQPEVKIDATSIRVLGEVSGVTLYVRPQSSGSFKKVGILPKGDYVGRHSEVFQENERWRREYFHILSDVQDEVKASKFVTIKDKIRELKGRLRESEEKRQELEAYAKAWEQQAKGLEQTLRDKQYAIDSFNAQIITQAVNEFCGPHLAPADNSVASAVGALIAALRRFAQRIKDLETQLNGERCGRANDHAKLAREYNEALERCEALSADLRQERAIREQMVRNAELKDTQVNNVRSLLRRTLKMGGELAQELL